MLGPGVGAMHTGGEICSCPGAQGPNVGVEVGWGGHGGDTGDVTPGLLSPPGGHGGGVTGEFREQGMKNVAWSRPALTCTSTNGVNENGLGPKRTMVLVMPSTVCPMAGDSELGNRTAKTAPSRRPQRRCRLPSAGALETHRRLAVAEQLIGSRTELDAVRSARRIASTAGVARRRRRESAAAARAAIRASGRTAAMRS